MSRGTRLFTPVFTLVWIAGLLQEQAWSLMIHFPGFLSDLGASETGIGLLFSLSAVFGLLLRPMLGRLMDNLGRRPVLLTAGVGNALALAALSLTSNLGPVLAAVFVAHRVLQIALFTALLTLGADVLPEDRRTQGLAIYGLGGLIPLATGGALGDWLLAASGFDTLFLTAALVSMASWTLILFVPAHPVGGAGGPRRGFWSALGQPNLLPVWWLTLLFAVGIEALFTFIRTFVDERQVGSVGLFFLIYGGVAIAVRILSSGRLDRRNQMPLIVVSMIAYGAGFAALALARETPGFATSGVLLGLGHGLLFPILTAQVVTRARQAERGSAMAIFTSLFDFAVLTAAPVVG
ncbi:MAG: MFS transporter, partial [Acidimicrobiia bacterium]|nr:MFS transporter [Acidimicrobiia bacterium]